MRVNVELWMALSMAVMTTACVTAPYHNQFIDHESDPVSVNGYSLWANQDVTLQCRKYLTGTSWTDVATFTSGASPTTYNDETVYHFSGSAVIPYSCWYSWHSQSTTELRFEDEDGYRHTVYDEDGVACIATEILNGSGPITAGWNCRLTTASGDAVTSMYIHASD